MAVYARANPTSSVSTIRKKKPNDQAEHILNKLYPDMLNTYGSAEYFTRDHLVGSIHLRKYSAATRLSLIYEIVSRLIERKKVLRINSVDLVMYSPEALQRIKTFKRSNEVGFTGRYTTRAADEISKLGTGHVITLRGMADTLDCLQSLSPATRYAYACRIRDDLLRRGEIREVKSQGNLAYSYNFPTN